MAPSTGYGVEHHWGSTRYRRAAGAAFHPARWTPVSPLATQQEAEATWWTDPSRRRRYSHWAFESPQRIDRPTPQSAFWKEVAPILLAHGRWPSSTSSARSGRTREQFRSQTDSAEMSSAEDDSYHVPSWCSNWHCARSCAVQPPTIRQEAASVLLSTEPASDEAEGAK